MQTIIWQGGHKPSICLKKKERKNTHREFTYKAQKGGMAVQPFSQMKWYEVWKGEVCGSRDDSRVAQSWKPWHLRAEYVWAGMLFCLPSWVFHFSIMKCWNTVTVRALASALSSESHSEQVSFPAPSYRWKASPCSQGVSELETQKQSQPSSLEGVQEHSLPGPPNHKDAFLTWPPSMGTDDPRPPCGSRTSCRVAGATTMDQPSAQAAFFTSTSTRLPPGA